MSVSEDSSSGNEELPEFQPKTSQKKEDPEDEEDSDALRFFLNNNYQRVIYTTSDANLLQVYEKLVDLPDIVSFTDKMKVNEEIMSISRDFLEAMSTVGRIIISERHVPVLVPSSQLFS